MNQNQKPELAYSLADRERDQPKASRVRSLELEMEIDHKWRCISP
jgi:hypothetical protein